jgi:hypothetical protein
MGLTLLTGNRGKGNGSRKVIHTRAAAKAAANGNGKGRAVELPILR